MNRLFTYALLMFLFNTLNAQFVARKKFPVTSIDDYNYKGYYARIGISPDAGKARILVKGSEAFSFVRITGHDGVVKLTAPNYTFTTDVTPGDIKIDFSADGTTFKTASSMVLHAQSRNQIEAGGSDFSMLFYGCFDPFELGPDKQLRVVHDRFDMNYHARQLFSAVALNNALNYNEGERSLTACASGKKLNTAVYCLKSQDDKKAFVPALFTNPLISTPRLIVGNGDQVYVDAGYHKYPKDNVSCQIGEMPQFKLSVPDHTAHMNDLYLASGSFDLINDAFSRLPVVNIWDDHEIRDGWGSQRDEYHYTAANWVMNDTLKPYYNVARRAYVEHQFNSGPNTLTDQHFLENNALDQTLVTGGKKIFAFDLRSERNINEPHVITQPQMDRFNAWIDALAPNEEAVIISSIPVSFSFKETLVKTMYSLDPELRDDLSDSWCWPANVPQRNEILKKILEKRLKDNARIYIVSGDLHLGAAIELWYEECMDTSWNYDRDKGKVMAYELISSALSHETLQTTGSPVSSIMHVSEAQRGNEDIAHISLNGKNYVIKAIVNISASRLNFGALDFKSTGTSLNVFLMDENVAHQYIVKADWNKTGAQQKVWEGATAKTGLFQKVGNTGKTYIAPIADVLRVILPRNGGRYR